MAAFVRAAKKEPSTCRHRSSSWDTAIPDNDSICAAVGYAYLKNELARRAAHGGEPAQVYVPARLGPLPPESAQVLSDNGLPVPEIIGHVHARVADVMTPNPISIEHDATLLEAGRLLRQCNVRSLVVTNDDGTYRGLITTRMIAERYISSTDMLDEGGANSMAVAADLIESLGQKVADITETDVLVLDKEGLLADAVEDLMASALREAVVLDDDGFCIGIVTRTDVATRPKRKVILVDHNETRQAAHGIEEADVVEIIDHHRIADVMTANPIPFINLPVGSTATIVTMEFRKRGVDIPRGIAAALLSAIMTDTVILKSPTATEDDREQVALPGQHPGGRSRPSSAWPCSSAAAGRTTCRWTSWWAPTPRSSSWATPPCSSRSTRRWTWHAVLTREAEIRDHMRALKEAHGYEFVLLMVTDILAEGSQFFCEGNRRVVNRVFGINCTGEGGTWMPGILSRKKQVAARILGA